jgi:hypothetical protein
MPLGYERGNGSHERPLLSRQPRVQTPHGRRTLSRAVRSDRMTSGTWVAAVPAAGIRQYASSRPSGENAGSALQPDRRTLGGRPSVKSTKRP